MLSPLSPADCPLLVRYGGAEAAGLIERFNAAVRRLDDLRHDPQLGRYVASDKLADLLGNLAGVRERMARQRYIIGCIGITQAGKSTTINNVLGEEVCKPGSGDACSSQPSRISFAAERSLDIEFLTPARYTRRKEKVCAAVGLPTPGTDQEVLELLNRPDAFTPADGLERPRLRDDLAYLKTLLLSYRANQNLVRDPAETRARLPYDERYRYTTHQPGEPSSQVLMLREARFYINNPQLPENLELCDLPGLDSKRSIDDVVTEEYLPHLDGVFLFVNVGGNLQTEGMLRALGKTCKQFGERVTGRMWVIFNKMDTLTPDHFRPGEDNVFAVIDNLLSRTGLPQSQVCFCSKKIWDEAKDRQPPLAAPAVAARIMSQASAEPPPTCPVGLRPAWGELLRDGGIGRIRALMFEEVAATLAGQIRADVAEGLTRFESDLAHRLELERTRLEGGHDLHKRAMTCYNVVLQLRHGLSSRLTDFPILVQQGEQLRSRLSALFEDADTAQTLAQLPARELARYFPNQAKSLNRTLHTELTGEVLDQVYQDIGKRLAGLPAVPVGPDKQGCQAAWEQFQRDDRKQEDWRSQLPTFDGAELAEWLRTADDTLGGAVYLQLMRDKIEVATRQSIHTLRARMRARLGELEQELARLIT